MRYRLQGITKVLLASLVASALAACSGPSILPGGNTAPAVLKQPAGWQAPEVLVAPSSFAGVHGLAVDQQGRLLAGSVAGSSIWQVDRQTGAASVFIAPPQGQADDIAIGARGEMAWTGFSQGKVYYRASDQAPIEVLAEGLPGINSIDFDRKTGQLYASQVFLGDALWEIDRRGVDKPRLIRKDMGGFNGFEVGPDGMLYGPLWFRGQVVKINPQDGALAVIADGFSIPAAVNLDGKGNLWVVDTHTGQLVRVELASGAKRVAAQLEPSLDNLAIAPDDGTIYVSNMANNQIQAYDPATGQVRTLLRGEVAVPAGLAAEGRRAWVADIFAFREIDLSSGKVSDIFRMFGPGELEYPLAVGISSSRLALSSWVTGTVQLVDRGTRKTVAMIHGLKAPVDAIPLDDGSVLIAEQGTQSVVRASGEKFAERELVASVAAPVQMMLGPDGQVYLTDYSGKLLRVSPGGGTPTVLAEGLDRPEGLARTPWGTFIVAEVGAQRLTEIDLATGDRRTVADRLPIGAPSGNLGEPPAGAPTGVAVDVDGNVYFTSDLNNGIYRIRPRAASQAAR